MVHTFQRDRSAMRILAGPPEQPAMHSLNGNVSTPLFDHLGSSSWHSYDAAMIVSLGKPGGWHAPVLFVVGVVAAFLVIKRSRRARSRGALRV